MRPSSLSPACAYAQSDQSLCLLLKYYMIVKLLPEHHLEFLSLKGGCRGSSESTHDKMSHYWKSHAAAQFKNNSRIRPCVIIKFNVVRFSYTCNFTLIYLFVECLIQDVREFLWLTFWLNIKAFSYRLGCDQFCLSVLVDQISCEGIS